MTYGELLSGAHREMATALRQQTDLVEVRDVLRLAASRDRLNRGAVRILQTFAIAPTTPLAHREDHVSSVDDHELADIEALRARIGAFTQTASVSAFLHELTIEDGQFSRPPAVASLLRASDYVGAAWDLLDSHVTAPRSADPEPYRALRGRDNARIILADAAMAVSTYYAAHEAIVPGLARGIARHLGRPAGTFEELDDVGRVAWLTSSLGVEGRRGRTRIRSAAGRVLDRLRPIARGAVDQVTVYTSPRVEPPRSPSELSRAAAEYSRWLHENASELTATDLRIAVSVASRFTHLAGVVHPSLAAPCAQAVNAWRACYHRLTHVATIHASPDRNGGGVALARGVSEVLSELQSNPRSRPAWQGAAADGLRHVLRFARVIEGSLFAGRDAGHLFSRREPSPDASTSTALAWRAPDSAGGRVEDVQLALRAALRALVAGVVPRLRADGGGFDRAPTAEDFPLTQRSLNAPLLPVPPSAGTRRFKESSTSARTRRRSA
ncbi:hypothetical protein [Cryptosporangium aurantiacum]|uniref:Uncharacterized protein n=1 Tax=Cryptosporangium aurantiacum TaxID=134849 RepID=A0A1M7PPW2_9ACTN|nr:hypothetical protein [Cryptosporangium aurantiacum]SHN19379.1 hypothetical protein SAMN05443668_103569 [Cryptosporangium aurantiacum]